MAPTRDASYALFGARLSYDTTGASPGIVAILPEPGSLAAFYGLSGGRYSFIYNREQGSVDREEESFFASEIVFSSSDGVRYEKTGAGGAAEEFIRSTLRQSVNQVLVGLWTSKLAATYVARLFVFGLPTQPQDIPAAGAAEFNYYVNGRTAGPGNSGSFGVTAEFQIYTLRVNYATGEVKVTLPLSRSPCDDASETCDDLILTGAFDRRDGRISGTVSQASGGYSGRFVGSFFGPGAAQIGLALQMQRADGSAAIGHLVASRI